MVEGHRDAPFGSTALTIFYQIYGMVFLLWLTLPIIETEFLFWIAKMIMLYTVWFFGPFVWYDYDKKYNKSS